MDIPLHVPAIGDRESERLSDVLDRPQQLGEAKYSTYCAELIEEITGTAHVLLTTSCTHALEMTALLLDVGAGDEIVMPSWTFPATANAFVRRGATPVFVDITPDTLTLDPDRVAETLSPDTAAIVPVHYAGVSCNMDAIQDLAADYGVPIVEDAAQGVCATYDGEPLGTFGGLGCYSFDWAKNYTGGEGGALLINDAKFLERAEVIHRSGTNYAAFSRGEVPFYSWSGVGSRYKPSELQSALVYTQLQRREEITAARKAVHDQYVQRLGSALPEDVSLPTVPNDRSTNYHIFYLLCEDSEGWQAPMEYLAERGITTAPHYRPLHSSEMGRSFGYEPDDLPVTEQVADSLLRLPIYPGLSPDEVTYIAENVVQLYT